MKSGGGRGGGKVMQEIWQHDSAAGGSESAISGRTNIPTDLLRTFVAICELGSFTKTAHMLDLTQPAVSAHMRRLESMIGADLIAKSLTGVVLTECGTEVLRHARRMLAINDQIVNGSSVEAEPQVVRVGIPNISAPNVLAGIVREGAPVGGQYRLQVCCDHSHGLLRSVRAGYLELVAVQFVNESEPANTVVRWAEDLVWVKAADFVFNLDVPVPLVSSPNLLLPDRLGMAALEAANRPYEIVFTAFDTLARRAAAEAGLGYFAMPRSAVPETLVIEAPGLLPDLPQVNMGIVARDDLDIAALAPLIARIESLFTAKGASA